MPSYRKNNPTADVLMTSMRSMGYTFEAAIADVVDNSVSAFATRIDIKFPIDPMESYVAICDNGNGMDADELFDAMKYGSQIKKSNRPKEDLGRFGLGLKSASLSQCRRLTVLSKKNGKISGYAWLLDNIELKKDWDIVEYFDDEICNLKFSDYLANIENGTVVLWEDFDIIQKSSGGVYAELSKLKESVSNYISLIFHRFLNRDKDSIEIYVDSFKVTGLDPFLEKHKKTNARRKIIIPVIDSSGKERKIAVQPYVLPFQKDLSADDKKKLGGIENYRTKQGYYIYRNERLIIWGTWFNRPRNELTKHARVKVDIPNTLDDIWEIDIKKQNAKIPRIITNKLTKAVDEAMDMAIKTQTYRGRIENVEEELDYIWNREKCREGLYTYKINRTSRIFDFIRKSIDENVWSNLELVFEEIENSVPYQQIYIDKSKNAVYEDADEERIADIEAKAKILISISKKLGNDDKRNVVERLFDSEPFNKFPNLKDKILKEEA
jgi:hypothetical protein